MGHTHTTASDRDSDVAGPGRHLDAGAEVVVHLDAATLVDLHAHVLQPQALREGLAPCGNTHSDSQPCWPGDSSTLSPSSPSPSPTVRHNAPCAAHWSSELRSLAKGSAFTQRPALSRSSVSRESSRATDSLPPAASPYLIAALCDVLGNKKSSLRLLLTRRDEPDVRRRHLPAAAQRRLRLRELLWGVYFLSSSCGVS